MPLRLFDSAYRTRRLNRLDLRAPPLLKINIIGSKGVGKSSLVHAFERNGLSSPASTAGGNGDAGMPAGAMAAWVHHDVVQDVYIPIADGAPAEKDDQRWAQWRQAPITQNKTPKSAFHLSLAAYDTPSNSLYEYLRPLIYVNAAAILVLVSMGDTKSLQDVHEKVRSNSTSLYPS